jgi:hypothetical protein
MPMRTICSRRSTVILASADRGISTIPVIAAFS